MTRKSSGEIYAQVKAEAANPRADIWWGGTGDPHMQAAEEGLTVEYKSPMLRRAAGLGAAPVGAVEATAPSASIPARSASATTPSRSKAKGLAEPKCWADLLNPKLKDEVQVADPNSSGTAYTLLATIVQMMGEDKGFDYLKALHKNVNQYTKSGAAPAKAASLGETTVGITFLHDMVTMIVDRRADRRRSRPARAPATRSARCRSSRARATSTTRRSGTTGR